MGGDVRRREVKSLSFFWRRLPFVSNGRLNWSVRNCNMPVLANWQSSMHISELFILAEQSLLNWKQPLAQYHCIAASSQLDLINGKHRKSIYSLNGTRRWEQKCFFLSPFQMFIILNHSSQPSSPILVLDFYWFSSYHSYLSANGPRSYEHHLSSS